MSIPAFTTTGDLPVGIHPTKLAEVLHRFGNGSTDRKRLAQRLERIYRLAKETGFLRRFVVFGSFVTSKADPNDVDVFMIMENGFQYGQLPHESALLFDHQAAESHFGCSVFWTRLLAALGGERSAIEDWQIKRDGNLRGIIEITGE
ncbi:MAG: DUF6932 family protein [Planctomycetaceae bacterium]